jgi:hypothetical protein
MSDRYDDDNFDDENDHSPAGLRKALEKAKREAKKAQEELAAEREARTKAEGLVKKSTLTEILKDKGVKPGLTRWLEKDDVEATPEAVDAWLTENGEFFNVKAEATPEQTPAADNDAHVDLTGHEDVIDPALAEALQASQRLDQSGVSPSQVGTIQRVQGLSTDPSKGSFDDLVETLRQAGAPLD